MCYFILGFLVEIRTLKDEKFQIAEERINMYIILDIVIILSFSYMRFQKVDISVSRYKRRKFPAHLAWLESVILELCLGKLKAQFASGIICLQQFFLLNTSLIW